MPEISLPTAAKQDEILSNVKKSNDKTIIPKDGFIYANFSENNTNSYKTILDVQGKGELLEAFFRNAGTSYPASIKITIDGQLLTELQESGGNNIGIFMKDYVEYSTTQISSFLSYINRYQANFVAKPWFLLEKIYFKSNLKIEAKVHKASGAATNDSLVLYRLT